MSAKISFFGATGTVTGSRHLLEADGKKMLIDCGLFQGLKKNRLRNWDPFPIPPAEVDRILLTHAHIDHSGYIPRFCKGGFTGQINCTHATHELSKIMLLDSGHLQEEDAKWANKKGFSKHKPALPLYTEADAEKALKQFNAYYYGEDFHVTDNIRVKFKDAGHILGSAFVDIKIKEDGRAKKILFSGDLGSPLRPILNDPVQAYEVDYLILESTYGDRLHTESHQSRDQELARVINNSINRGGTLIIPSFAVERSQEILYYIRELEEKNIIPSVPVYLDSPMAIDATRIFKNMSALYDFQAKLLLIDQKDILNPEQLTCTRDVNDSKALADVKGPAIILSASGMLQGGRILHHLQQRLSKPENTVLFVGYQAEGTRGRALLEGKDEIKIHGQKIPVRAIIENISGFSGHADYNEIIAWLMGFNRPPIKTFIVHGEHDASKALAKKIESRFGWKTVIPEFEQTFLLE